jgi:hypothetical protein
MSKHFKKHEILGYMMVDGRKVTVLRMGVTRKRYYDYIDPYTLESHINQEMINYQKAEHFHKVIMGEDDFTND